MSPALDGEALTNEPPGKSPQFPLEDEGLPSGDKGLANATSPMCEKLERVFFLGSQASVWGAGNLLVKGTQSPEMPAIDSDESALAVAAQMELKTQPHTAEARVCPSHLPGAEAGWRFQGEEVARRAEQRGAETRGEMGQPPG